MSVVLASEGMAGKGGDEELDSKTHPISCL